MFEELDLMEQFCEPVVKDEVLLHPNMRDVQFYRDALVERNANQICAWCKCPNRIICKNVEECPVFCSKKCQFNSQQHLASLLPQKKSNNAIGAIVEKFPDQKPPKKLHDYNADEIEGHKIRVGPFRENLNEIEKWFGNFAVASFKGMNENQKKIFDLCNEMLEPIGATLKTTPQNIYFFSNIDVKDPKILTETPEVFKRTFAFAIFELLTETDMMPGLSHFEISPSLYEDMLDIVSQSSDEIV